MSARRRDTGLTSPAEIGSDLARVDAYANTPADYEELPDMADRDPADGVRQRGGVPKIGRPPIGDEAKRAISLRLDKATLERFKASGPGWQTKMGVVLARNEDVLKMIRQNVDLIDGLEEVLAFLRKGELQAVFAPIKQTVARVERDIRTVTETTNSLRDQLVV